MKKGIPEITFSCCTSFAAVGLPATTAVVEDHFVLNWSQTTGSKTRLENHSIIRLAVFIWMATRRCSGGRRPGGTDDSRCIW